MLVIDAREDKTKTIGQRVTHKVRVSCTQCSWVGIRRIQIDMNFKQSKLDKKLVMSILENRYAYPTCPHCNQAVEYISLLGRG